jgi:Spy/CpxP family protein refolding chaperone
MAGWALHGLELSNDQREQIHEIVHGYVEGDLGERFRDFDRAKRALEIAIWNPDATEGDLGDASESVAGLARQLELARHRLALDVLDVLTEQQSETFQQMLQTEPPLPGGPGHSGPDGP